MKQAILSHLSRRFCASVAILIDQNDFLKFFFSFFPFDFNHSHSNLYRKLCEGQLRLCV